MDQKKNKIGILIESDFYENEIFYYQLRFPEEGYEVHFLSRLWGNPGITFQGHEFRAPFYCSESFEDLTDDELNSYAAFIVPAGMVADRLRYTEDISKLPPACQFLERIFSRKDIVKCDPLVFLPYPFYAPLMAPRQVQRLHTLIDFTEHSIIIAKLFDDETDGIVEKIYYIDIKLPKSSLKYIVAKVAIPAHFFQLH